MTKIIGTNDDDLLVGGDHADTLRGRKGDDTLISGAGTDVVRGGHGADTLIGGRDFDKLYGGRGADLFIVQDFDQIADFQPGIDKVMIIGWDGPIGVAHIDDYLFLVRPSEPMAPIVHLANGQHVGGDDLIF